MSFLSGKILEPVILDSNVQKLTTTPNQFGYKRKIGMKTAIFVLKQVAHHNLRNDEPVYVTYLVATKAFDMVYHWTLLLN